MSIFSKIDAHWMSVALKLANQGRFSSMPNPNVGCVIINAAGNLIGQGFHQKAGQAHAEVNALIAAGFTPGQTSIENHVQSPVSATSEKKTSQPTTAGATVYVTLEPCCHFGRTPPCALALIEAQVARVVIASIDTNPEVHNKGVALLEQAGIQVESGLMANEANKLNCAFNYRMRTSLPWVTIKLATSLDGKTALANGESKWITGPQARTDVQIERSMSCAILSGADTVIADNPRLNVRSGALCKSVKHMFLQRESQPLRVIIDGQNRLDDHYQIFHDDSPVLVFNAHNNPKLTAKNTQQIQVPFAQTDPIISMAMPTLAKDPLEARQFLDLHAIMHELAKRQINRLWTEAGASLSGALFAAHLVNELIIYQAPKLLGNDAKGMLNIGSLTQLDQAIHTAFQEVTQIGSDLKLRFTIKS